jgi:hypothetical protein
MSYETKSDTRSHSTAPSVSAFRLFWERAVSEPSTLCRTAPIVHEVDNFGNGSETRRDPRDPASPPGPGYYFAGTQ